MKRILAVVLFALATMLAAGCSETTTDRVPDTSPPAQPPVDDGYIGVGAPVTQFTPVMAIVATAAADYSSGAHSIIDGDASGSFTALNELLPTTSDLGIAAFTDSFYRIEKLYGGNNITRFALNDPQSVVWQYSTNDPGVTVGSNPYDIVFVNASKAYVLRYGSPRAWIVNPSATNETDFKIGELDLSAYGGTDGIPDMGAAVIANGKLFILLQRLEGPSYQVVNDAYIAVFDIATDQEIDAGISGDNLKGIPLQVRNPTDIIYQADSDKLFVAGSGSFFPVDYSGGIETIDASTYASILVMDDSETYGLVTALVPVSAEVLYFVGYRAYDDNTLYVMDIANNRVAQTKVPALLNGQISDLALDKQGLLWVGDTAQATVRIIDPANGEEISSVSTSLNPLKIVFAP